MAIKFLFVLVFYGRTALIPAHCNIVEKYDNT
jgi:hypothetical protein